MRSEDGVGGASGPLSTGSSPTLETPVPVPAVPAAPRVYNLPSGGIVRLRPRKAGDGEDQEARPSKSQRANSEDNDDPDLDIMEALDEA